MGISWFVVLGLAALMQQGIFASSPTPVPEDEWVEFAQTMRNSSYRLPTTTRPSLYELTLTPYFEDETIDSISLTSKLNKTAFTFDGKVAIHIKPTQANVKNIVLHCNNMTIDSLKIERNGFPIKLSKDEFECEIPYSFLRIETVDALQLNQEYIIRIDFTGHIQAGMRGFYRSWYIDSSGKRRWMGTTQFQPGHARQAFPCYDEPGFKAKFDITILRNPDFSPTLSNMPIKETKRINGRIAETFYRTPLTSTYILAFIVSHYKEMENNNNSQRPFKIYARDNVGITGKWSLVAGVKLLAEMERITDFKYYTMADKMSMIQAAIPDFSAGAMENWGLPTYREANILYDPNNSNHFYKQRVANIISHEVAHMWFGNLVTCAWWDNLWLNEAFGRFYQYYLTDKVYPELGYDTRFIIEQVHVAMVSDSVDSAHALTNPAVSDPDSVSNHFSTITYARGASVLRMTQYLLGETTYVKGLRKYILNRQYDVAEPHHLFEALDAAAQEDKALSNYPGITIDSYLRSWSEKAGHPLLTVTVNHRTGQMTVYQARWERNNGISKNPSIWQIPITWTRGNAVDFLDLKPSQVLTAQVTVLNRGTSGHEWVIFNKQQSGFYRVDYDDTNWALLTRTLRSENRSLIHEHNRAQIVDDLFVFARAGTKQYNRVFNILSYLEFEDEYAPWLAAITGFNFALRRLAHDTKNLEKLQKEIIKLSATVTKRLGYVEIEGEHFMDGLLRMYVLSFLCNIGHEQCEVAAKENFAKWKQNTHIPANMRPWVYCSGLRQGDADDFDFFWNRFLQEDLANEISVMLESAGCTSDAKSLEKFLNAIVDGKDTVRKQDQSTALNRAIRGNEFNTMRFFEWMKKNFETIKTELGGLSSPIREIGSRLLNEQQFTEFSNWLEENREVIGTSAYNAGIQEIETSRSNIGWTTRRISEFESYFDTGYVEDVIEDITDGGDGGNGDNNNQTTTTSTTTVATTTEQGDSANIATIGLFTVFVSVLISLGI